MKKYNSFFAVLFLAISASILLILSTVNLFKTINNLNNSLNNTDNIILERSYLCADLGYRFCKAGISKDQLFFEIEKVIGKRKELSHERKSR